MNVHRLSATAEQQYRGSGYALAAISSDTGDICQFEYLSDIADRLGFYYESEHIEFEDAKRLLEDPVCDWAAYELSKVGRVVFGMFSCRVFTEL